MIFIIGGRCSGKLEYVLNLYNLSNEDILEGSELDINCPISKPIINNFHLLIKKLLKDYDDIDYIKEKIDYLLNTNKEVIIISDEIGYGIVPIEKFDREYREFVGRISCDIAKRSNEVHRVIAGIGSRIK